jgi:hypothetical protein
MFVLRIDAQAGRIGLRLTWSLSAHNPSELFVCCALGLGAASHARLSWEVSTTTAEDLLREAREGPTSPLGSCRAIGYNSAKAPPIKLIGGKEGALPPRDEVVVSAPAPAWVHFAASIYYGTLPSVPAN